MGGSEAFEEVAAAFCTGALFGLKRLATGGSEAFEFVMVMSIEGASGGNGSNGLR